MTLLPLPSPDAVVGAGRSFFGWAGDVVDLAARLPGRVEGLLDEAGRLIGSIGDTVERVDGLLGRADVLVDDLDALLVRVRNVAGEAEEALGAVRTVAGGAEEVVESARSVAGGAGEVVESARSASTGAHEVLATVGGISGNAQELLSTYSPMLERAAPLAERFVADLTTEEVDAAIRLVDQLPVLTEHMVSDVLPILETLDRVGPDIHELLDVTKELRQAIDGIPGLGFLKKRGAAKDDDED